MAPAYRPRGGAAANHRVVPQVFVLEERALARRAGSVAAAARRILAEGVGHVTGDRDLRPGGDDWLLDPLDVHKRPPTIAPILAFERHERVDAIGPDVLSVTERNQGGRAASHCIGDRTRRVGW